MEITLATNGEESSNYHGDEYGYGDEYMYPVYDFERAFYLYLWEIVVVIISIVNVLVISVLLNKNMRNATNIIFAAIAVSDSLSGLVTLPTYIMVFQRCDQSQHGDSDKTGDFSNPNNSSYNNSDSIEDAYKIPEDLCDAYKLTENLCEAFMMSKYFFAKWFHTVSIFLTLFLAIQRYVAVAFPFMSRFLLNIKRTIISCLLIFVLSPLFDVYHVTEEKVGFGMCEWDFDEHGDCRGTCIYLWISFFLRHLIPCVTLIVLSVMFVGHLRLGEKNLCKSVSSRSQMSRRTEENRRISLIVISIVVTFLVPEIPYSIFLLYNALDKAIHDGKGIDIRINRIIQFVYDIALVLSFHANVYIYIIFNKRFRKLFYKMTVNPVRMFLGGIRRLSITRTSSSPHPRKAMHNNSTITSQDPNELEKVQNPDKLSVNDSQSYNSEMLRDALEMRPLDD